MPCSAAPAQTAICSPQFSFRFKGQRGLRDGHEVNISDWLEVMIEGPERFDGREETQETMEERRLRRGQVGERTE